MNTISTMELDGPMLKAAMAMFDDWNGDADCFFMDDLPISEADTTSTSSSFASDTPEPVVHVTRTSKKSTNTRRREEILSLKSQMERLTQQLEDLQHRQHESDSVMTSVWEDIAARQLQERRMAEEENARLRSMLNTELPFTSEIMGLCQEQMQLGQQEPDLFSMQDWSSVLDPANETDDEMMTSVDFSSDLVCGANGKAIQEIEEEQLRYIDQMYQQNYGSFAQANFDPHRRAFSQVIVDHDDPNGTVVNINAAWVTPFPHQLVADTLWQHLGTRGSSKQQDIEYQVPMLSI